MKISDEELIGIIRKHPDPMQSSETALLISRYSRVIRIKAAKMKTADIEFEDLCQEGYLALFDAVRSFDGSKGNFAAYAGVCIGNRMLSYVKKSYVSFEKDDDFDFEQLPDSAGAADEYIITKENNSEFSEMLLSLLTEKEYKVLRLYIEGYTYKQIAERMDISPKSADNALARARKKLKDIL